MTAQTRTKRQYLSANVHRAYKPGTWLSRHKDGQHFQVGQKAPMSPRHWKTMAHRDKANVTSLELEAVKAERDMEAKGVKGFMIGIKLKDGTREEIPLMAQNWHQAFFIAHKNMMKYDPEDVDEIVIVDPSLSEIAHAISGGAHKFASAIKAGVEKIPSYAKRGIAFAEKAAVKTAREAGRIARIPGEARDVYELEKARREGAPRTPTTEGQTEEQILAEASRLQRIGVAGAEPVRAAKPSEPSAFAGYTAEEWKALRERRAAEAKARAAPMTRSEAERRRRTSSRPFQSSVFGSKEAEDTAPEEQSPSTALRKVKRQLRRAQRALRRLS
ncbi:MAG: hypothetical protein ABSB28_11965 [Candidatus Bathyarchaeia archaeon]